MSTPGVRHWDINAKDARALQGFYSNLFGWTLHQTDWPNQYAWLEPTEGGIGGGIGQEPRAGEEGYGQRHSGVTFFVGVDDVQAYLDRAERLGGRIVWGPMAFHGHEAGLAMFEDPEGNRIGLMRHD